MKTLKEILNFKGEKNIEKRSWTWYILVMAALILFLTLSSCSTTHSLPAKSGDNLKIETRDFELITDI